MRLGFVVIATAAAAACVLAVGTSAHANGAIVERYVAKETWHSFADVGLRGAGPGDLYLSQQSLATADGKPVGVVNGFGVNLKKPFVFFHWTGSIGGSSLTLAGAIDVSQKIATYAIAGGTGRFAAVRGTVTLTDLGDARSLVVLRYHR